MVPLKKRIWGFFQELIGVFTMNKKIWSKLLSCLVAMAMLFSMGANVMADPVDDQQNTEVTEQQEEEKNDGQQDEKQPEDQDKKDDPAAPQDDKESGEKKDAGDPAGEPESEDPQEGDKESEGIVVSAPKGTRKTANAKGATSEEPGFELVLPEFNISSSGYTDFTCTVESLVLGPVSNGSTTVTPNWVDFIFEPGTLSDGNGNDINFRVANDEHNGINNDRVHVANIGYYTGNTFKVAIYIDPSDYSSAAAGTYTGNINYKCYWTGSFSDIECDGGSAVVTLTVHSLSEIIASGNCGDNVNWSLTYGGTLNISGTGDMNDFDSSSPWSSYKDSIKSIVISNGVTSIGNNAFKSSNNIESITIPSGVTKIGNNAFYRCENLAAVSIPSSVLSIGNHAFYACDKITEINFPSNLGSIGENAFYDCDGLTSILLPDSVTNLGQYAFAFCRNVTSVTLSNNLTSIPDYAFEYTSITSISIPSSVTRIGKCAFCACSSLASISAIPNVTTIDNSAFYDCIELESIDISGVTSLGRYAFHNSGIKSITIPEGVTAIKCEAFSDCEDLEEIIIPSTVTSIEDSAFIGCSSLKSITLPAGITAIADSTFENCTSLSEIVIPAGVKSIGRSAFAYSGIQTVSIPDSVASIDSYAFSNCSSLKSVTIPGKVTTINDCTFNNCSALKTLTLLNGVEKIEDEAFELCSSLKTITIPRSVTKISSTAFRYCGAVTDIFCYADPAHLTWKMNNAYAFGGSAWAENLLVHVPGVYVDAYKTIIGDKGTVVGDLEGEIDIGGGVHLYGYSLSLRGNIGVNFYLKLDQDVIDSEYAYIQFKLNGEEVKEIMVKDVQPIHDNTLDDDYYVFALDVAPKEMADQISIQVFRSGGDWVGDEFKYTVKDYAEYILTHSNKYSEKTVNLVKSMLNYGAYSQIYFNYNTGNLANSSLIEADKDISGVSSDTLLKYAGFANSMLLVPGETITYAGANLELESELVMNIKFKGIPSGTVFKVGNKVLNSESVGNGETKVTFSGITAKDIDKDITITLYIGDGTYDFTYNPMTYCYNVISREITAVRTQKLKDVVSALYWYNEAAKAFASN